MPEALPALADDEISASEAEPALPLRNDTILGVCEALGQDLGFNPNYLRVALASLVLWNSLAAIGIYLVLGIAVALSRWIFPAPRPAIVPQQVAEHVAPVADNQADAELLAA